MKRLLFVMGVSMICIAPIKSEVMKLSLGDAIEYALSKNFTQQSLSLDRQIGVTELNQSKLELLPDVTATVAQNYGHTQGENNPWNGVYGVDASLSLFDGGKNVNTIRKNRVLLGQYDSKIIQSQTDLTISVIQAFLEIIMNRELYNYLQVVANTSHEQMLQGETKYKLGQIIESDYLLLKAQAASDKFNVVNTETDYRNSILQLKYLLSMSNDNEIEVQVPAIESMALLLKMPSLNEVIAQTFEWFPDIKIAEQNIELSSLAIKIAKSSYLPSLSVGASIGTGYMQGMGSWGTQLGNKFNQQVGFTLSIPIWDKGRTRSQVKQAGYKMEQEKLNKLNAELQLRQQLEQEYNTVVTGYEKFVASEEKANAYRESAVAYRKQFELGQITTVELLQQETNYLSALNDYIRNKYSYLLNRKLIDVYMGIEIEL